MPANPSCCRCWSVELLGEEMTENKLLQSYFQWALYSCIMILLLNVGQNVPAVTVKLIQRVALRSPNLNNYFWLSVVCPHGRKSSYLNLPRGHKQKVKQPRAMFLMWKLTDMPHIRDKLLLWNNFLWCEGAHARRPSSSCTSRASGYLKLVFNFEKSSTKSKIVPYCCRLELKSNCNNSCNWITDVKDTSVQSPTNPLQRRALKKYLRVAQTPSLQIFRLV